MIVVVSFFAYAGVVGLFVIFWDAPAKAATLIDIMKTFLLPVVTLVLGFYFGRNS